MATQQSEHELKQQGAIEAAQDPNSSVTADQAQKKIVADSEQLGVTAFTFDPNASAADKAAQAREVRPSSQAICLCSSLTHI